MFARAIVSHSYSIQHHFPDILTKSDLIVFKRRSCGPLVLSYSTTPGSEVSDATWSPDSTRLALCGRKWEFVYVLRCSSLPEQSPAASTKTIVVCTCDLLYSLH